MAKEGLYERKKGRARYDPHIRLYFWLTPTLMERLSGNELKLLVYLMTFEKGSNNGEIFMSARQAAEGIHVTKKTALRALHGLDRAGLIRPAELGYFQLKGGPATKWRLTFLPAFGKAPTNEWRQPPSENKSWGEKFPVAGVKTTPPSPGDASAGVKTTPATNGNPPIRLQPSGVISSTQTIASTGRPALAGQRGGIDPEIPGGDFSASLAATLDEAIATVWGISRRNSDGTCDNHPDPASLKAELRDPRFLKANGTTTAEWMVRLFSAYLDDCDDGERAILDRAIRALAALTMTEKAA